MKKQVLSAGMAKAGTRTGNATNQVKRRGIWKSANSLDLVMRTRRSGKAAYAEMVMKQHREANKGKILVISSKTPKTKKQ